MVYEYFFVTLSHLNLALTWSTNMNYMSAEQVSIFSDLLADI